MTRTLSPVDLRRIEQPVRIHERQLRAALALAHHAIEAGTPAGVAGSPWLGGQSAVYIKAQLQAFASGTRRNDISQQMRNIARGMTAEEIDQVSRYYEAQP